MSTDLSEVGRLTSVVLKHARDAFVDAGTIEAQWRDLHFNTAPDFGRAVAEYDMFLDLIQTSDADVHLLPPDPRTTLDSIYVRDASIVTDRGIILCSMGKRQRSSEPEAQEAAYARFPSAPIVGEIRSPGHLEGGDLVWLDAYSLVVGLGYRTNEAGIRQLRDLLGEDIEVIVVPLPHWRGTDDVMHLMSLISPVDRDLAVVYSPLMPVPFRELLLHRGVELVEVPDEEFATMGGNVLALAPRRCLMLEGNPRTRSALQRAGAEVLEYEGREISVKGAGGPTCLTRPLVRERP
jgi:N-dimethylarginine dimethylaminohydrolase